MHEINDLNMFLFIFPLLIKITAFIQEKKFKYVFFFGFELCNKSAIFGENRMDHLFKTGFANSFFFSSSPFF